MGSLANKSPQITYVKHSPCISQPQWNGYTRELCFAVPFWTVLALFIYLIRSNLACTVGAPRTAGDKSSFNGFTAFTCTIKINCNK